ncbi:J domain-containing protein, partial [Spirulina subsalsa FACHB-351]
MNLEECYSLLGLQRGADLKAIKASYRRLARRYHPDVNPQNKLVAQEAFIRLNEAYQSLIKATLEAQPPPPPPPPPPPVSPLSPSEQKL